MTGGAKAARSAAIRRQTGHHSKSSGVGGWAGAIVAGDLDPKDPTAALGFVGAVPDLKQKTTPGGTLYVFALPPS